MANLNVIADALAAAAENVVGLYATAQPVESPQPPAVEVVFVRREQVDSCGGQRITWVVEVSLPADQPGWEQTGRDMRDWLSDDGASSVEAALEADRTLGGAVDTLAVTGAEGAKLVPFGDGRRWLGRLLVDTWT